jgi:hypothetical protein
VPQQHCEPDYRRGCDVCRCAAAGEAQSGGPKDYAREEPPKTGGEAVREAVLGCGTAPGRDGALAVAVTALAAMRPRRQRIRPGPR